ncbi:MAG: cobaltochelatase subunit CobN [Prochloraceae cyanobacterium]|nr:cobaltochelatase subunit CobN [Prochloraceae cyanobacterium]
MHLIPAIPGGWNPNSDGVIFIEQTPAPIVLLTAADTDIQTLAACLPSLTSDFPAIRAVNLLQLQQELSIDNYAEKILPFAKIIILRLLGGRSYWSYGLEVVKEIAQNCGTLLFVLPGDDRVDPDLISHSTNVPLAAVNQLWRYFIEGGIDNLVNALKFVANLGLGKSYTIVPPQSVPKIGIYAWNRKNIDFDINDRSRTYKIGLLFYRAHYLAGNTRAIDAICHALAKRNLEPLPIFISSLRDRSIQEKLLSYFQFQETTSIELLLNTTSFSLAKISSAEQPPLWKKLDVPVLQVILSGSSAEYWESSFAGLTPRDVAMNVALPEVDGRIITRAVSFKSIQKRNENLETDVVIYQPKSDRVEFVANLVANWVKLKQTPLNQRKIALILANYPNRDGRLANGVGLDTPASCVEILKALQQTGYTVENIPENGDELITLLTAGVTNDREAGQLRPIQQYLSVEEYQQYFASLPSQVQQEIGDRWGGVGEGEQGRGGEGGIIPIAGVQFGNVFVGIQPSRGYDRDPSLNYHAPDLEPTHDYLAYYYWLREKFGTFAIVHVGKHGNLEWLPGKSLALSSNCYPEIALDTIPHFYPFIVNDPGEGSQAKRRASAVIIDHLTPPMTRAELYGPLQQLETLIDEYYQAQSLDPSRLKIIEDRIVQLIAQTNLDKDLGINNPQTKPITEFLTLADGYLCELKEAQIRDGLHIFGKCPQGKQLIDLIVAIARSPSLDRNGLTQAIAQDLNLDFNPLTANPSDPFSLVLSEAIDGERGRGGEGESGRGGSVGREGRGRRREVELENKLSSHTSHTPHTPHTLDRGEGDEGEKKTIADRTWFQNCRTVGDAIEIIEQFAASLIENLIFSPSPTLPLSPSPFTQKQLQWIKNNLLSSLQQTQYEITNLLKGLDGKYVPSGASGAPTRGRPDVLPTGRNFYSVDIRAIPTETAWDIGRKAAEVVIERYTQENGEYPKTLAISVWGTSTMRTGGDDIAQVLALLGVRPVWDGNSRRVVDFEILPVSALGRPRVDVTLRISGFFRDSFPNLIDLVYNSIAAVSSLQEPEQENPLAAQVKLEREFWRDLGLDEEQAEGRSLYRIFGSKPGAYGAGLQGLIEAQNWSNDEDLARAYINWSSYAYTPKGVGKAAPEAFEKRLKHLQIVLHNQDNREHDLLDSDDYYQFQGGLTAAVRAITGKNPQTYFGDNSIPANPRVRQLKEEIARVYRSRVINPKWIDGVMRHGYKGAFEMAATVDYLFAYDATARCVEDFMYEGVAETYLFDAKVQDFIRDKNPWALRDMAERLLEANQRGLWQSASQKVLEQLKAIVNEAEGIVESMT